MRNVATQSGQLNTFRANRIERTKSSAERLDEAHVYHQHVSELHSDSALARRERLIEELEDRQNQVSAKSGVELLRLLSDAGFAWSDVARLAQVSIPAIQKWRRGAGMTGQNRFKLAKLVAILDVLDFHFIQEPVSWLEMPLRQGIAITRMDLMLHDRYDLLLESLNDDDGAKSVTSVLDEFNSSWRDLFVDAHFETFIASDGVASTRPKS
ncbi:transcriptional regulator [Clavibacter michiganensis subsp. phaseoli]|uniref:Transcriptional regulator n=1 Tax=Clavibacter phaseoli TaxID=1734031 RepID=A0A8I0SJ42_9MICO|nr:transcriptional regulator [Clavibacter phaseoli]MBF4631377.1 transcriptional regulator [Clavibacter phaseoli]